MMATMFIKWDKKEKNKIENNLILVRTYEYMYEMLGGEVLTCSVQW